MRAFSVYLKRCGAHRGSLLATLLIAMLGFSYGCQNRQAEPEPSAPPSQAYTGPEYLRGTVGSLVSLRNYRPLLVEGYGLVVGLEGTGSSEVPEHLRQQMLNQARQMGMGQIRTRQEMPEHLQEFASMSPEQLLRDESTAVVAVQGLIPPGATRGTRFDLLVSALPETQTTSLSGGTLFTTELGVGGTDPAFPFTRTRAEGRGSIYVNPFDGDAEEDPHDSLIQAVVVGGGRTTEAQQVELVLNQASWTRSRIIADRINERFHAEPGERIRTAEAQDDMMIRINVPNRYAHNPEELLNLISHLYVNRGVDFEAHKARELAEELAENPESAERVSLAWRALGRRAVRVLREYYEDERPHMQMAALEAGAWLGDGRTVRYLQDLIEEADSEQRIRIAEALADLPESLDGSRALRRLLEDEDHQVRIAAYESLADMEDPWIVERTAVRDEYGVKFYIDRIDVDEPMLYVTQDQVPRLVIFNQQLGFEPGGLARVWDNRLMLRNNGEEEGVELYYQPPGRLEGQVFQVWPSVAAVSYMLAHTPTRDRPHEGLGLSYSEVVEVLHELSKTGYIAAPMEANVSPWAEFVSEYESIMNERPETSVRDMAREGERMEVPDDPPGLREATSREQAMEGRLQQQRRPVDEPGGFSVPSNPGAGPGQSDWTGMPDSPSASELLEDRPESTAPRRATEPTDRPETR